MKRSRTLYPPEAHTGWKACATAGLLWWPLLFLPINPAYAGDLAEAEGPATKAPPAAAPPFSMPAKLKLPTNARVMIIPVNDEETTRYGMIDAWQAAYIGRKLREARRAEYDLVILEIDTHGGEVAACETINKHIAESLLPVVAFVRQKAFSGGALISLGCRAIAMEPGSQIGGAQVVSPLFGVMEGMKEKAEAYMKAMVRGLCEANGYPISLALGMVDRTAEIYETNDPAHRFLTHEELKDWTDHIQARGPAPTVLSTWKKKDEILSLSAAQAFDAGLAAWVVKDQGALFAALGIQPAEVTVASPTSSERFVSWLGQWHWVWSVLLVVVALVALIWELRSPGHGLGYLVFAFCLGLFFWLAICLDRSGTAELILFGLGALLLAVELFVLPGFGFAGFAGSVLVLTAIILSFIPEGTLANYFKSSEQASPFQTELLVEGLKWASAALVSVVCAAVAALVLGARLPGLNRIALRAQVPGGSRPPLDESAGASTALAAAAASPPAAGVSAARAAAGDLVGKEGVAETILRPGGKVRLEGVTYDATAEAAWVNAGTRVRVLQVTPSGLLVREV